MTKQLDESILRKQTDFETAYYAWFDSGLKEILTDNRRRYRMQPEDKEAREARGLSALPSTKSTSVVDSAVERALLDYHGDPGALSYTSKSVDDIQKELGAQWLTKVFQYRAEHTFPFFTWHTSSLTAAFVDGLEAAMVTWKKTAYTKKETVYVDLMSGQQIDKAAYDIGVKQDEVRYYKQNIEQEILVHDTWWIDQLKPGEQLLWDFKIPYLDINLGQVALVKVFKPIDEIVKLSEAGFFTKITKEEIKGYTDTGFSTRSNMDTTTTATDPNTMDLDEFNRCEVWYYFEKIDCQWKVSFSLQGKKLLSDVMDVNELFFGGRPVNRLPVVLGTTKLKLWENIGRGLPETIASIEDEWEDHRNNLNDAAKIAVQGKYRIEPDSDVFIDDVLNARAFRARKDDVEQMPINFGLLENMRASEPLSADMNELIPVGMSSRMVVPKGTDKTLGAVQMSQQNAQDKLSVQLMVRNQTFMVPLMYLIAQLEFAYETDDTVLKIAGNQAGFEVPQTLMDGQPGVDISVFDFDVDVQINAGLGSAPRAQKINNLMTIVNTAKMLNIPINNMEIFNQTLIVAGYQPEKFLLKEPPPPPPPQVEYKLDIKTSMTELQAIDPDIVNMLIQKWHEGQVKANTTVDEQAAVREQMHNGGMRQTGDSTAQDMTQGSAAAGMSRGGQG